MRAQRTPIHALTGLRFVAAFWVVLFHFEGMLEPYVEQVPFVRPVISAGWIGVELFFVLSGFVIGRRYLEEVGGSPTPKRIWQFVFARFARVWPAWATVTVLMCAWVWVLRANDRYADVIVPHPDADAAHLLRDLTMTQMWGEQAMLGTSFVLPGWSISAEWLAYLAFPLLAVLLRPLRRLPSAVHLVLATLCLAPQWVLAYTDGVPDSEQNWVLRIACGFTAGLFTSLALRDLRRTERVERAAAVASVLCIAGIVLITWWSGWLHAIGAPGADHSAVAVALYPLLVASLSLTDRGPARFLSRRTLVYGGTISYSLYLVHFVVLDVLLTVIWQDPAVRFSMKPSTVLAMPLVLLACIGLSALLHRCVEEPGRKLLTKLVLRPERTARRTASTDVAAPVQAQVEAQVEAPVEAPVAAPVGARIEAPVRAELPLRPELPVHSAAAHSPVSGRLPAVPSATRSRHSAPEPLTAEPSTERLPAMPGGRRGAAIGRTVGHPVTVPGPRTAERLVVQPHEETVGPRP